ncbi:MAG: iron ABC transporter permease [Clostridiaceae bacterium]|nr:iron ABC transporter permease [Clostridiaceae bacterium]
MFLSTSIGSVKIPLSEIVTSIRSGDRTLKAYIIIMFVRIPRTLAAVLAGCALSVSGAVLQSVLNNSLASPNVIGVNSGAGLFTVLIAAFFPASLHLATPAAFAGALLAVFSVYFIARKTGASKTTIVLSGVAVSSFIGAITDTLLTLKPDTVFARTAFLIGGFSGITMEKIRFAGIWIVIAMVIAFLMSRDMNVLMLGDESARSLGLNTGRVRFVCMILSALLAGSAVSFAGQIGFVGLIVPHTARIFTGQDNRILLPVSALLGGIFVLMCDLLARILFAPFEIPAGIIMSFLGGPFFIYLLIKAKKGQQYD